MTFDSSLEWAGTYPPLGSTPNGSLTPPAWIAALNAAVSAGQIPNVPRTTLTNSIVTYPTGVDPTSPQICSGDGFCRIPGDIWDGVAGIYASNFDDGPAPVSALAI
jgi:hypothetical protein